MSRWQMLRLIARVPIRFADVTERQYWMRGNVRTEIFWFIVIAIWDLARNYLLPRFAHIVIPTSLPEAVQLGALTAVLIPWTPFYTFRILCSRYDGATQNDTFVATYMSGLSHELVHARIATRSSWIIFFGPLVVFMIVNYSTDVQSVVSFTLDPLLNVIEAPVFALCLGVTSTALIAARLRTFALSCAFLVFIGVLVGCSRMIDVLLIAPLYARYDFQSWFGAYALVEFFTDNSSRVEIREVFSSIATTAVSIALEIAIIYFALGSLAKRRLPI